MIILSFESSCDETSVAVTRDGVSVLSNEVLSQIDIFKEYGGVVPEISSREHVKGITYVYKKALKDANMTIDDIDYIAVTEGPGLIGSLLTGINAAKTVALNESKPLVGVNHLSGHIYSSAIDHTIKFPCLAVIISGGHTELVVMKDHYDFNRIGSTLDDAVGEVFDKVARILGLEYPGGPLIDKIGKLGSPIYNLPRPMQHSKDYNFSFSGLKSAVSKLIFDLENSNTPYKREDIAISFEKAVADVLSTKIKKAIKEYSVKEIVVVGGSAANSVIRESLQNMKVKGVDITFPQLKYCGDNAAMIGISAYYKIKKGEIDDMSLKASSRLDL
ncbi:MAG: tRNA (adenosine(37)-N6)-threonylcarbamoyltransferase complex transferase subunit TsaD [Gammaproteobacteria bacterium]|nr:tRNA (adenosine(37)-N6)-threonylcarbamoyltransferase complex transferase subunit TsaD [Gammaproteobacteria bacterium]